MLRLFVCFVFLISAHAHAATTLSHPSISVSFSKQDLRVALEEIAKEAGIVFRIDKAVGGTVSAEYRQLPVRTVLSRLLKNYNYVLVSNKGSSHIKEVHLFKAGSARMESGAYDTIGVGAGHAAVGSIDNSAAVALAQRSRSQTLASMQASGELSASPRSAVGVSQLRAKISKLHQDMSMLKHKYQAEQKAIAFERSKIRKRLDAGEGDPEKLMEELKNLEGQALRSKQRGQQQVIEKNKQIQASREALAVYGTPAQQKSEVLAGNARQLSAYRAQQAQLKSSAAKVSPASSAVSLPKSRRSPRRDRSLL